ncbi:hypothetical protein BDV23DRAFT_175298 [Aspergillus alliaceus]|uniref:Alcohol dehydrogenase-like N-terminal domain-containing protein n=1 Tax=Petromyces alliaceus TaxID=209559 RepID=A0A5N7BXQ7_PETAA|nr:hypothetical protein BDV23DRAFT_175298 [Aspergillus alliaceus]
MFPNHSPAGLYNDLSSAIIRITAAGILPYHREIYNGQHPNPIPTPLVGGFGAIGHITALAPDTAVLKSGQLVYIDCVIRGRDDPDSFFLSAIYEGFSEGSRKLMRDVWRDGTFAEYAMRDCVVGWDFSLLDLVYMGYLAVPYGGLWDIGLEARETVIVCPATGFYSGIGVQIAAAMGARVIAMGRSGEKLGKLKEEGYLMGATKNIRVSEIMGKMMYERDAVMQLVKMIERDLFPLGRGFLDTKMFG